MTEKKSKSDWPALLLLIVGLPVAFTYGGLWVGLAVLVISVVALGWSKRHNGPYSTNQDQQKQNVLKKTRRTKYLTMQ